MESLYQMLEAKDIALLYEIWSCFALIRAVKTVLGRPVEVRRFGHGPFEKTVPWEYRAKWSDGTAAFG